MRWRSGKLLLCGSLVGVALLRAGSVTDGGHTVAAEVVPGQVKASGRHVHLHAVPVGGRALRRSLTV